MLDDTRLWWATRLQKAAQRVASGPQPRLPEGTRLIDEEALSALVAQAVDDNEDDNEPLDPDEMRHANLNAALALNDDAEPLVEHVRSIRANLMETRDGKEGFSEEAAEHMCMAVWHALLGVVVDEE